MSSRLLMLSSLRHDFAHGGHHAGTRLRGELCRGRVQAAIRLTPTPRSAWSRCGEPTHGVALDQFRLRSTIARCLIHGIMARSLAPISSIGCAAILPRIALNEVWLTRFSSIQLRVKVPDWMSARMRFISARVSSVTARGPETYSPSSAVLDTE